MLIKRRRGWELPESAATPESVYLGRRTLIKAIAAGPLLAPAAAALAATEADPSAKLYPAKRNPKYTVGRPPTPEKITTHYNNFYEFGSQKEIADMAQAMPLRPWTITIDGMVEKPFTIGIDDLLKKVQLEERIYRHRCVEAWSIVVPWTGFPVSALVDIAKPLGSAKYIRTETFLNKEWAPGERAFWYPWPYVEGMTMFEARNELAFIATGMYGQPMPKQDGAPLRVVLPWKYGFKSGKSIVRFNFTDQRPETFWAKLAPTEYGFWANVNPEVPHPRWSQATERDLGSDKRIPTRIWNGYGEFVAHMYDGLKGERLFA